MSDNVYVDQGEHSQSDAAVLLLAAAEELNFPAGVVTVNTTGASGARFSAPEEVVKKAGMKAEVEEAEEVPDRLQGPTPDFYAEHEGEVNPEQHVATDETPGATTDATNGQGAAPQSDPEAEAQAEAEAAEAAQAEEAKAAEAQAAEEAKAAEAEEKPAAKKAAAKKTTAKKTAAKKTGD